MAEKRETERRC